MRRALAVGAWVLFTRGKGTHAVANDRGRHNQDGLRWYGAVNRLESDRVDEYCPARRDWHVAVGPLAVCGYARGMGIGWTRVQFAGVDGALDWRDRDWSCLFACDQRRKSWEVDGDGQSRGGGY